jgi:Rieske Fe-S protein
MFCACMEHLESPDAVVEPVDDPPTRRGFLGFMTVVLGAVPIVGGLFAAVRSGLAPAPSSKPEEIPLCKLSDVPADGIKEIAISYQMRQGPLNESVGKVVFVTIDPETKQPIAMSGECTHLSCPVQKKTLKLDPKSEATAPLTCPCHGGMFSRTGERLAGPPKDPLKRLTLRIPPADKPDEPIFLLLDT